MKNSLVAYFVMTLSLSITATVAADPDGHIVDLSRSPKTQMSGFAFGDVSWTDGFWADRVDQTNTVTLQKLWDLAADPDAGHVIQNMKAAATGEGKFAGTDWQDAWLYKWIESAACVYHRIKDPRIAARMDEAIELIAAAQEDDGYISTQITATGRPRFENPRHHEVYSMGHLLTAAVVHKRMTGKDSLMKVATRTADFLCETLGDKVSPSYAHNPSAVMGMVEMYRATGNQKYLDCAKLIVDSRGANPKPGWMFIYEPGILGTDLIQDRTPLRRSTEVVGHNVFFTYLFAGAADVYLETGDQSLVGPLERLWTDLSKRKMSINGGVSPMGRGLTKRGDPVCEAVGEAYYLPNGSAYNETCGQIGNFMWNYRMLAMTKQARYADMMEREMYNGFLGGIGLDGASWFYRNTLRRYDVDHDESGHNNLASRVLPGRKRICCPTNLLRTFAQLHTYFYSVDDEGLWVHHYGGTTLKGKLSDGSKIQLTQKTDYPWDGKIEITFDEVEMTEAFAVRVRIPEWVEDASVSVCGRPAANQPIAGTYLYMKRQWRAGDAIQIDLPMRPRLMQAHPKAEQLRNQVAVLRGPILYCIESVDLPDSVDLSYIYFPSDIELRATPAKIESVDVQVLDGEALYRPERPWDSDLYRPISRMPLKPLSIRMIPYFTWNNRGKAAMSVWLPVVLREGAPASAEE